MWRPVRLQPYRTPHQRKPGKEKSTAGGALFAVGCVWLVTRDMCGSFSGARGERPRVIARAMAQPKSAKATDQHRPPLKKATKKGNPQGFL